ncbi:hypothetical protein FJN17_07770 [Bradyrhizobium symbiodeficiens]|uniref:Uncharacterized protein n=1 Tax=Bradyrhizobium symbiodeficiens TaxID=1404367 RepID=A0ABX5W5F4_9BRAD|nr:hypothetical protein [Bradyrhizobium symbiodeficiens]QDF37474.1 hypothetical protein FJN17_07770 [Bradyrhizobium symbiodeficiens]
MDPLGGLFIALSNWEAALIYVEKIPPPTAEERRREREENEKRRIERLVRAAERRRRFQDRLKREPNVVYLPELAAAFLLIVAISAIAMYAAYWLYELLSPLVINQDRWLSVLELACAAILVGYVAWYLREVRKAKLYPIVEIALGSTLSVQGMILDAGKVSLLAAVVAFVGGVRIIIDGFKRFFEYRTVHLSRPGLYEYYWRKFKRGARWILAPKDRD